MPQIVLLRGANVLRDGSLEPADVLIDGAVIAEVSPIIQAESADVVDVSGRILAPGFIDVHVHGGGGHSLLSTEIAEIEAYCRWAPSRGVTSFVATICAASVEEGIAYARAASEAKGSGATVLGVNFEGPFVSPERCGALPRSWLQPPDAELLKRMLDAAPVRVMTVAPELPGAHELMEAAARTGVRVSVGHSDATFEVAKAAFDAGASHVTHAFNAMRPLHHREPGPIGAAIEVRGATVEAIADGVHLHPATVRLLAEALGSDRLCLVTDAVTPAGLPEGAFRLGGKEATLRGGAVTLPDGTIAGSAATMDAVVRNVVDWGIAPPAQALSMASAVPAHVAGVGARKGRIEPGYDADIVLLSAHLDVEETWVGGRCVYRSREA